MTVMAIMPARFLNLVEPLPHEGTAMRITDTAAGGQAWSGAVSRAIGAGLGAGDVDSSTARRTAATTPGSSRSTTATRTTTTRTTTTWCAPSADSTPTLDELTQAYLDCRRQKRNTINALRFELNQERELVRLHGELVDRSWRPGRSICFVITHPKHREVWAAEFRDRIVHHLFYNRVAERFHRGFVNSTCACIPGRGTLYGAALLEGYVRSITQNWSVPAWYLKMDLANFFVSIDKHVVYRELLRKIHEPWLQWLASAILFHDPRGDVTVQSPSELMRQVPPHKSLFNAPADHGLPIGNLSSQFFANVLLNPLDQHVRHQLRVRHYVRYVDDLVLLDASPHWLNHARGEIEAFLPERLHLQPNPAKTILQPVERGVDFVGQVIEPWRRTTRRRTVAKALQRIEHMDGDELFAAGNSYLGLLRQATRGHADRAQAGKALRYRGHALAADLTKIYRSAQ